MKSVNPNKGGGHNLVMRLVPLVIIALVLGTVAVGGCVRNAAPAPQPTSSAPPVSGTVTLEPQGKPVPVPAVYQGTYDSLKTDMDKYDATLATRDTGTGYPVIFGAELLQANVNRGDALLQPQVMDSVRLMLDRYKAMGIQGVTIPDPLPGLHARLPTL